MPARSPYDTLVTVYGGSGFLGRHLVRALAKRHYRIRVAVRRPDLAFHLQPLGRVGQIHAVQANLRNAESVEAAARGADVVVNLVGILFERGRQRFDAVHSEGAANVARAAKAQGARLIHVSAIGADANSTSSYARSKAAAEALVREIQGEAASVVIAKGQWELCGEPGFRGHCVTLGPGKYASLADYGLARVASVRPKEN